MGTSKYATSTLSMHQRIVTNNTGQRRLETSFLWNIMALSASNIFYFIKNKVYYLNLPMSLKPSTFINLRMIWRYLLLSYEVSVILISVIDSLENETIWTNMMVKRMASWVKYAKIHFIALLKSQ